MQMMTVEIVNQFALWINLPIQLTESVNLNVYLCSNTISDVYHFVQLDIMPIQLVTVWCQLYVTQVYLMERMEQLSALLLVQQDPLQIPTLITVLQSVPMVGSVMLILVVKLAKLQAHPHRLSLKRVEQTVQN